MVQFKFGVLVIFLGLVYPQMIVVQLNRTLIYDERLFRSENQKGSNRVEDISACLLRPYGVSIPDYFP